MSEDKKAFDITYFFKGEGWKDWFKAWGSGYRLVITIVVGGLLILGVRALFVKKPQNINQPHITVASGGKVDYQVNQIGDRKRLFIPFVEVYTFKEGKTEGFGYGLKAGVRFEF